MLHHCVPAFSAFWFDSKVAASGSTHLDGIALMLLSDDLGHCVDCTGVHLFNLLQSFSKLEIRNHLGVSPRGWHGRRAHSSVLLVGVIRCVLARYGEHAMILVANGSELRESSGTGATVERGFLG